MLFYDFARGYFFAGDYTFTVTSDKANAWGEHYGVPRIIVLYCKVVAVLGAILVWDYTELLEHLF